MEVGVCSLQTRNGGHRKVSTRRVLTGSSLVSASPMLSVPTTPNLRTEVSRVLGSQE